MYLGTSKAKGLIPHFCLCYSFQPDDLVLIMYDTQYCHHVVYTPGHTLHFVHSDSLTELGLNQSGNFVAFVCQSCFYDFIAK